MKSDFFELYDVLISGVIEDAVISSSYFGKNWAFCETDEACGIAMSTQGESIAPLFPSGINCLTLKESAKALKSWNLYEASLAHAALNSFYNTVDRLNMLNAYEPFDNYCTSGLDYDNAVLGIVGHMHGPRDLHEKAKEVYILERSPKPGDYPDSACDLLLPRCDMVLITGSSLVNKTLPHLLELCSDAVTILVGPTVPMCPALLDFGIDRLAGLVLTDRPGIKTHVENGISGSPYPYGSPFLLKK